MRKHWRSAILLAAGFAVAGCGAHQQTFISAVEPGPRDERPLYATDSGSPQPREVALAFAKAIRIGDMAAARKLSFGSAKSYQALQLVADFSVAAEAFMKAIATHENTERNREEVGIIRTMTHFNADLDAEAKAAKQTITGDSATIEAPPRPAHPSPATKPSVRGGGIAPPAKEDVPAAGTDDEPVNLKKVAGEWKVDLDRTIGVKHMATEKDQATWKEFAQVLSRAAAGINAGMTADQAMQAAENAMRPPATRPATRPAATRPARPKRL